MVGRDRSEIVVLCRETETCVRTKTMADENDVLVQTNVDQSSDQSNEEELEDDFMSSEERESDVLDFFSEESMMAPPRRALEREVWSRSVVSTGDMWKAMSIPSVVDGTTVHGCVMSVFQPKQQTEQKNPQF